MKILVDDLQHPAVRALIREHLQSMHEQSPPESVHALGIDALRAPGLTFWCAWDGDLLLGCGALKELDATHGEIKSMRTPNALRRLYESFGFTYCGPFADYVDDPYSSFMTLSLR